MESLKKLVITSLVVSVITLIAVLLIFGLGYQKEEPIGGWYSPDIVGIQAVTTEIAKTDVYATSTLRSTESGTTYLISASGTTITLPAVANKGVKYRFIISGDVDTGNVLITSKEGDNIEGSVIVAGAVVDCDAADVLTFVADGENIGDYVELISTGTYWVPLSSGALTESKLTCSG